MAVGGWMAGEKGGAETGGGGGENVLERVIADEEGFVGGDAECGEIGAEKLEKSR